MMIALLAGGHAHGHAHGGSLWDLVLHTFLDTLPMIPVLFVLYFVLEYLWHHRGVDVLSLTRITGPMGPVIGALLGVIPQCGMSVFATSLYLSRRISLGTLVATYLATSDEALPVLLAHGGHGLDMLHLIAAKLAIGVLGGGLVDAVTRRRVYAGSQRPAPSHIVTHIEHELHRAPWREVLGHSARRTGEIAAWVFGVTLVLGIAMEAFAVDEAIHALASTPLLEISFAGVFGLIPNCGASIAIAEAYLHAGLSFGATIAGLSAGAGYGPIVLFKDGDGRHALAVMALCAALAVAAGLLISLV